MVEQNYWLRTLTTRRRALRLAAAGGSGVVALSLVGCGGDDSPQTDNDAGTTDTGKGKPGGRFVFQNSGYHNGLLLARPTASTSTITGLVHSALLAYDYGRPPSNTQDVGVETDLAEALPEQPDELTYVFKLRDAQFHNGRTLTSEDVKYSFTRYASPESSRAGAWTWLERVETPDAKTVVMKTKTSFADAVLSTSANNDAFIMAKEFEEGPDVANRMMGSGPFVFDSDRAPVETVLKKNPSFYLKPYPYFDEVTILGSSDPAKQLADFASRQVHLTYWQPEEQRDEMKRARPDAKLWAYQHPSHNVFMRTDQPPFNDKRVRQALSIALDRKRIREAVSKGEGKTICTFSPTPLVREWG